MNYRNKLRSWFDDQKKVGLQDIKFYPGEDRDVTIEQASERVYQIVTEQCETVDITDKLS